MMRAAIPLAALLMAGCATVDRAPAPATVIVPPAFILGSDDRQAAAALADLLPRGDAAFVALETRAMANAPTLGAALARIDAARAGLRGARAARLPEVSGSAGVARQENNSASFGGAPIAGGQTRVEAGLTASWDADLFGRLRASQAAAAARIDAAGADAAGVRLSLSSDIAIAVLDWRETAAREAVIRADLGRAEELVSVTGVRTRAGISPGFDLVRAQSLAADAQGRLDPIGGEQAEILGRLVRLTALSPAEVQAALALTGGDGATGMAAVGVPSALLRARPDIAAAEARLAAADSEIAAAAAERFPRLSISGTLGLLSLGFGSLFDEDALIGSLGASIAGPLLDFGRVGARIDQRQAEARIAFEDYRGTVFQAIGETETALGRIGAIDRRTATLARQVAIDADAVALARERYRLGLDPLLATIDAERTLNASRRAAIEAGSDARRARVALYRALGGVPL